MSKKNKNHKKPNKFLKAFSLPKEIRHKIWGVLLILLSIIICLSFFKKAGIFGEKFINGGKYLIGEAIFLFPLFLFLGGFALLKFKEDLNDLVKEKNSLGPIILAIIFILLGIVGIFGSINQELKNGGIIGYYFSLFLLRYFGFWASQVIFVAFIIIGSLIFWHFLHPVKIKKEINEEEKKIGEKEKNPSLIKKILFPSFKIKEVPSEKPIYSQIETKQNIETEPIKIETKPISNKKISSYQPPPTDLLEKDKEVPNSGDIKANSLIIKKTLANFGIDIAMSEVSVGPTVTQYAFKPAEGIKLSKITSLSNDLALSLASHPIRIEAPIPGRSLVGIEVPNKTRAQVRFRNLVESQTFQKSSCTLSIILGRDVSGAPVCVDLTRMPHLLIAGSTGSGKTIFLNTVILSLLYQPNNSIKNSSPQFLRFILIDPKRVEFPVYESLPHLLCPVIYNASQTVNVLKWLISEMERRFDVLSEAKTRDIASFNEYATREKIDPLPFIVVVIDELADLMAARGKEIEAAIVRLAQMARAVGIHLIVATQRPSVEVITGLIKANITSRVTFQVASQVDSRTIIDTSGAEKLLGSGDMLYVSSELGKPKRIQAPYISDKEVKKVVSYIVQKGIKTEMEDTLIQEINKNFEEKEDLYINDEFGDEDPLFEEAKRVVIEARKASASLLQRRLRIGYARAARLIDMLEDRGIVGPADGAKPREVYGVFNEEETENENKGDDEWQKI